MSSIALFSNSGAPLNTHLFEQRPGGYGKISLETVKQAIEMAKIPEPVPFGRKPYAADKATPFGERPYAINANVTLIEEATAIAKQAEEENPFDRNRIAASNAIVKAFVTQESTPVAASKAKVSFFGTNNVSSCVQEAKRKAEASELAIPSVFSV